MSPQQLLRFTHSDLASSYKNNEDNEAELKKKY